MTYTLCARMRSNRGALYAADWLLAIGAFAIGLYHWVFEPDIYLRAGMHNTNDLVVGIIGIVLEVEAARRGMGWALPCIGGAFLASEIGRPLCRHRGCQYVCNSVVAD